MRQFVLVGVFLLAVASLGFSQDSAVYRTAYAGSYMVVPEGQRWEIDKAFINSGGSYNILINSANFSASYASGDTLRFPYYIADMELLDDQSMVQYVLRIREQLEKK